MKDKARKQPRPLAVNRSFGGAGTPGARERAARGDRTAVSREAKCRPLSSRRIKPGLLERERRGEDAGLIPRNTT